MMLFPTNEAKTAHQSLFSVYFQIILYYDQILTYFALIFQYFLFVYKYSILYYAQSTIAAEIILLTLLLALNPIRIDSGTAGNKGRKYLRLLTFIILDIFILLGFIYVATMQSNALYLETIIATICLIFVGADLLFGIALLVYYRATD